MPVVQPDPPAGTRAALTGRPPHQSAYGVTLCGYRFIEAALKAPSESLRQQIITGMFDQRINMSGSYLVGLPKRAVEAWSPG